MTRPTVPSQPLRALTAGLLRINLRDSLIAPLSPDKRGIGLWSLIFLYAFMGLSLGLRLINSRDPFLFFLIVHGSSLIIVGMAILIESGDMFTDTKQADILDHLPIARRTLITARLINLTVLALILNLSYVAGPMFYAWRLEGARPWAPLTHVATISLFCVFCPAATMTLYGLLARRFKREWFESMVSWSQIVLGIGIAVMVHVIFIVLRDVKQVDLNAAGGILWLLPPTWFAALDTLLATGWVPTPLRYCAALAPLSTVFALWLGVRLLTAGQERQAILEARGGPPATKRRPGRAMDRPLSAFVRWWVRDPAEEAAFRLAAATIRRDQFTMRGIYQSVGVVVIFPLIILLTGQRAEMLLYLTLWIMLLQPLTAIDTLRLSKQHKAADLFFYSPLGNSGPLFNGVRKAVLYYSTIPTVAVAAALLAWSAIGVERTLSTVIPCIVLIPTLTAYHGVHDAFVPLSVEPRMGAKSSRLLGPNVIMWVLIPASMIAIARLVEWLGFWPFLAIELPILALIHWRCLAAIARHPPLLEK